MDFPPIVSAEWLADHRSEVVVADVRWYLDGRSARAAYDGGHISEAVFVDLDTDLAGHDQPPTAGRHPLPTPEAFADSMGKLGIDDRTPVVAYDDSGGVTAGRMVVMLRAIGHRAAILSGGISAWSDFKTRPGSRERSIGPEPLSTTPTIVPRRAFTPRPWPDRFIIDHDELTVAQAHGAVLVDARAADRYRGDPHPIDSRSGHIPGARNLHGASLLRDGHLKDPHELRELFEAQGITKEADVIASCGSGVSACIDLIALEHAGLGTGRLFVPSWSGWAADAARQAVTGDQPH